MISFLGNHFPDRKLGWVSHITVLRGLIAPSIFTLQKDPESPIFTKLHCQLHCSSGLELYQIVPGLLWRVGPQPRPVGDGDSWSRLVTWTRLPLLSLQQMFAGCLCARLGSQHWCTQPGTCTWTLFKWTVGERHMALVQLWLCQVCANPLCHKT